MKKLWEGSKIFKENSHLKNYSTWLEENYQLQFENYNSLWQWSTLHIEEFWESVWKYFKVTAHTPYTNVLSSRKMPGCNP